MPTEPSHLRGGRAIGSRMNELIMRAAAGDQQAFSTLYDEVAPRVHGLIVRVVVDRAQADEVTQEVFLETWRKAHAFDPARGSGLSWLLSIAHRRAVDRVRSSSAARTRDENFGARASDPPFDSTAEHVMARHDADAVHAALGTLSDVQREALEMAYFGGCTHTEVAAALDIPLGTAKARIRDGLRRLRDEIGGER